MSRTSPGPETVSIHVPFTIRKRGGRKVMVMPEGAPVQRPRVDNTMIKALARAFRWKKMLDSGEFATASELAERERIATTYMARLLRLTLLAPNIVEAIAEGTQPPDLELQDLLEPFPVEWSLQVLDGS